MEIQFGPNPVDQPNLLYKLQRKIKVFNTGNNLPNRGYSLIASSSKYGLVFVGAPEGTLSVYQLKDLIDKECEPQHFAVKLPEKPTHIAVSCDHELLATTGGQVLCVYKVVDFQNVNVSPPIIIRFDTNPATFVSALQWNPCIPDNIAVAFFDGTLLVSMVASSQVKKVQSKARCICWSPKGKQLVTGNSDGTLCQYKPDLTLAKTVPAPNLFENSPVEALAIYWIATFQFAVVFRNAADNSRPAVTIVNTPKAGQPTCLNYEDICYSMEANRPWYYYLLGLAQWNTILTSSSKSMEIATLGTTDGAHWLQWAQPDEARPELPLTDKKVENYPVGICIDTCAIHQLPWGENDILPYMPLLHVVSQSGLLTIFNMINFNKDAMQVCSPPQLLSLPAAALTSDIPDDAPAQVTMPAPPLATANKPAQPPLFSQPAQPPPFSQPVQPQVIPGMFGGGLQFGGTGPVQAKPFGAPMQPPVQAFSTAAVPASQPVILKQPEVKPAMPALPQNVVQPKPQTEAPKPQTQTPEANAAIKAEQDRINKLNVEQELRNMLVKEVNDFQMELYKFTVRTREVQHKLQQDLNTINANFNLQSLDTDQLKKECDLEDLRSNIVQLKLELVRACAVVAEARTQAEAKDLQPWTQADPLTTKRVASVKKLAYYVQTQLEHAHKALDYKWNEITTRDLLHNKPGQRMIRPILDDVYQPLVKQQEILSRQQAVLRTLRNTLKECDTAPMFKSTSLLRSTPFKNKDPLSKLTKNILNMSIEPQNNKPKEFLTPQKLDALRDMLSNHKPIKIKPVNVELRQHLAQMRISYQKSVKAEANKTEYIQPVPIKPKVTQSPLQEKSQPVKPLKVTQMQPVQINPPQPMPTLQINTPIFTPVGNIKPPIPINNVVRTLFTEDSNKAPQQPQIPVPTQPMKPQFAFASAPPNITASANTRSILKDMLQNKQANNEAKNDANTFMGQKICSPNAFAFSTVQSSVPQPNTAFTSKPISDINNMFSKFTPQTFAAEPKMFTSTPRGQDETGEPDNTNIVKPIENKAKEVKPVPFQVKQPTPLAANTKNVPDVLKTASQPVKTEKPVPKTEKAPEKSKENVPAKTSESVAPKSSEAEKENVLKPSSAGFQKPTIPFGATAVPVASTIAPPITQPPKVTEAKPELKVEIKPTSVTKENAETPTSSSASSIFAAGNAASPTTAKPQPVFPVAASTPAVFSSPTSIPTTTDSTTTEASKGVAVATTSATSIFAAAAASQPAKSSQSSLFSTTSSSASSVFGSAQASIFASSTTPSSVFGTTSAESVFSSAESKPTVFSTPTPASPTSVFGGAVTSQQSAFSSPASVFASATTQSPSTFGGSGSVFGTATSTASVFGTTATTPPSPQSVFGAAVSTTAQSVFGSSTTTTQSVFGSTASPSIFASAAATAFGSPATTAHSVFGTPTATTASTSIFGSPATTQASIFGSTTPTTQPSSVFGATTQASVFGSPTPSTQASAFGTPTATTQASVFGSPQTTQASIFGSQPATTASGSIFGATESLFASTCISTTNASSPTSGGNIFGGGSPGSVFGTSASATNVFGRKPLFNMATPQASAIFGSSNTAFAPKPAANFWSGGGNTSGGSVFGSSGFGQQATTQSSSIFGASTGGSFSSPSSGQGFGSPQPQQASVFGSPQQQTSPGFGAAPAFGAKPAFGQSSFGFGGGSPPASGGFGGFGGFQNKSPNSGFGAPAAFGGGATFGGGAFGGTSPGKMFGGAAPAPSFAPTQSNATFESLATQNTLTFGNLAQQTTPPSQPPSSFNTSPSFTGWRG